MEGTQGGSNVDSVEATSHHVRSTFFEGRMKPQHGTGLWYWSLQ